MPGVMSAFDERGCAVVDTLRNRWHYFTGDEAWVWESVEVTGSTAHLEPRDSGYLAFFVESGLMLMEDDTTSIPFTSLDPGAYEYDDLDVRFAVDRPAPSSLLVSRAWLTAARLQAKPLHRIVQHTRRLRTWGYRYLTEEAMCRLHMEITDSVPWWVVRAGWYTERSIALATCLAAHRMKTRVDVGFGMSHVDRVPEWWCEVPGGTAGRRKGVLTVSTV